MTAQILRPGMTIAVARRELARHLRNGGIESPEADARILLGYALNLDRSALLTQSERLLTSSDIETISTLANRRLEHEPIARILGQKEFWKFAFYVDEAVLVPRPETETVIEAVLDVFNVNERPQKLHIADLGTGSGIILLTLLSELPDALGVGTDRDTRALAVAQKNAERIGVKSRANFVACDYGTALTGAFNLVVANPPYIASDEIKNLAPDVALFDPLIALDGGHDGLNAYRAIAADAKRFLAPEGRILLEIGFGQANAVIDLLEKAGLKVDPRPRLDLAGIPRVISAVYYP